VIRVLGIVFLWLIWPLAAFGQENRASHCIALAQSAPGINFVHPADYREPLPDFTVRLSYVAHSMFLLQTPGGVSAVTDYAGYLMAPDFVPDIVTMNHAHVSHWTARPDPRIANVLKGWGKLGAPAAHMLRLGDLLVRNVTTDIRRPFGEGVEKDGNSIFVFEVEGLCIGHLGHLHQEPNAAQYAALGRLDVVMAAVDGGQTLDLPTMMRVIRRLKSAIVIPMHWWNRGSLDRFLRAMSDDFDVVDEGARYVEFSLATLPRRPTIQVLQPYFANGLDDPDN